MTQTKQQLIKAKDEALKIEARAELCIGILEKIVWKNKPTSDDMQQIRKVIEFLKDNKK